MTWERNVIIPDKSAVWFNHIYYLVRALLRQPVSSSDEPAILNSPLFDARWVGGVALRNTRSRSIQGAIHVWEAVVSSRLEDPGIVQNLHGNHIADGVAVAQFILEGVLPCVANGSRVVVQSGGRILDERTIRRLLHDYRRQRLAIGIISVRREIDAGVAIVLRCHGHVGLINNRSRAVQAGVGGDIVGARREHDRVRGATWSETAARSR